MADRAPTPDGIPNSSRAERVADLLAWPVIAASLATIPLLIIEQSHPHGTVHVLTEIADWVIWLVFVTELVLMLAVVEDRWAYLKSHPLDVAIIVLTPPILPVGVQWVRVLRVLRLVRLLRVPKMMKHKLGIESVEYGALLVTLSMLGGAAAFSAAEGVPYGDAIYWAIGTMTTAGYGDVRPTTTLAKVVSCVLMVVGTGFFALVTGAVAQRFLAPDVEAIETAVESVDAEEDQILSQIRSLGAQITQLEAALVGRQRGDATS